MIDVPTDDGTTSESPETRNVPVSFVYSSIAFLVMLLALQHQSSAISRQSDRDLKLWLEENRLQQHQRHLSSLGCVCLISCASLVEDHDKLFSSETSSEEKNRLERSVVKLKRQLTLNRWLKEFDLVEYESKLSSFGITNLETLVRIGSDNVDSLNGVVTKKNDWQRLKKALQKAKSETADAVEDFYWKYVLRERKTPWTFWNIVLVSSVIAFLVGMASTMSHPSFLLDHSAATKLGFFTFITGKYLSPQHCLVEFNWQDPQVVGNTVSFIIRFFQRNGRVYPISNNDNLLVEITQGTHKIACSVELGGTEPSEANQARVQFSVRRSGDYSICVLLANNNVKGSPFEKRFLPGPPEPQKTAFVHHCSTVVCTEYVPYHLFIEPRDKYGNVCTVPPDFDPSDEYTVDIVEINSERPMTKAYRWECHSHLNRVSLVLKFDQEGCYRSLVYYRGIMLQNGDFHIIVLNKADGALVQKNVAKKSHNIWYEAKLLGKNGDSKLRKVFCYISPKQLTIKEYVLKFIPKRLVTFRLCPSTKFQFKNTNNQFGEAILVIDDGCQVPVELLTADRNVIVATFAQFLLKNIGGSETFKDKQDFFYHEVRKMHQKHFHDKLALKISRDKLLESSIKAIKGFNNADWCRNFEITFAGEQGLDWGGLRREWFELLCVQLFSSEFLLFQTFKNDKQGLVHPNPKRPSYLKLKHYEFAGKIVGKCLYESALGSTYRQLVKARFSRSFLAQLIGLRVHYKYFEQDDPDLYVSKIKYILENDVDSMELFFTEEEYADHGQLLKTVDLIPNGANVQVTNLNKHRYLDALAQYRLTNSIKDEVDHFLKGLNELIPDSLLCIFDENELELLMCGTGQYSISDFKTNHAVSGASYEFRKILDWFWTAVSNFTEEEMARLLQFTTGCSQLPPGGFGELNPRFHITAAPTFGNLPTAHTCFNQLCLPDYDNYDQFDRALRLAINEGSEGFGMV